MGRKGVSAYVFEVFGALQVRFRPLPGEQNLWIHLIGSKRPDSPTCTALRLILLETIVPGSTAGFVGFAVGPYLCIHSGAQGPPVVPFYPFLEGGVHY